MQRHFDAGAEMPDHPLRIERHDLHLRIGEVVGEEAGAVAEAVVGIGDGEIDLDDAHLERVAGLGSLDRDWAGQDMAAGTAVGLRNAVVDRAQALLNVGGRNAGFFEPRWAVGQQRVNYDRVAGLDVEHRLGGGVIMAPGDGLRSCWEIVSRGRGASRKQRSSQSQKRAHDEPPG